MAALAGAVVGATASGLDGIVGRNAGTASISTTAQKARALFHPIRIVLTGRAEGPELDLAIPAIDLGAELPATAGIPKIVGCRERAAAFVEGLATNQYDHLRDKPGR